MRLRQQALDDSETLGLLLAGSRAAGTATAESDYDVYWVLTDAAHADRARRGEPDHIKEHDGHVVIDRVYTSPARLREMGTVHGWGWWTAGVARARPVLDKTGEVVAALEDVARPSQERARDDAAEWFDGYLNSYYRSLKAWRKGDELAGRLEAAESISHLVRTLFSLERRWPPYPSSLNRELEDLSPQGWPRGYLRRAFETVLSTGDPPVQQELEQRVERLMRERGFGSVVEAWEGEIERVSAFRFESQRLIDDDDGQAE